MAKAKILSVATSIPANTIDQEGAYELACQFSHASSRQTKVLKELYKRTRINKRHNLGLAQSTSMYKITADAEYKGPGTEERMQKYKENVAPLAIDASSKALVQSGVSPSEITHLITISCTGFYAPGFDFQLIKALDLPDSINRFHLGFMGCNGALNGLNLLRTIIESDSKNKVLLCAAELCSLHYQYGWQSDNLVANSLFADCSGAVVAEACDEKESVDSLSKIVSTKSYLIPDSADAMTWTIGDNGFSMTLSSQVPDYVQDYLPRFLNEFLSDNELKLSDINSFAIHPGGPRVLRAVRSCLGLSEEAIETSKEVLAEYGNMSSPTVLFILERLKNKAQKGPCLVLAFGPGLVIEACLIK